MDFWMVPGGGRGNETKKRKEEKRRLYPWLDFFERLLFLFLFFYFWL
jgi:hypothetical protein